MNSNKTEALVKCACCNYEYPKHLLQPFHTNATFFRGSLSPSEVALLENAFCGLCALTITNKIYDTQRTEFIPGSAAESLRQEAIAWQKSHTM
jgi:hypothetical protein